MVIGANPTDGHPVFASQLKRRLREGAKLIVDRSARDRPRALAARRGRLHTCSCGPAPTSRSSTRWRTSSSPRGSRTRPTSPTRCEVGSYREVEELRRRCRRTRRRRWRRSPACRRQLVRGAARLYAAGANSAIYYGLGVTEHSQGTTMVMGIANLAMATGNLGREGVGVNPLRGQNNVQGSCDMGSFPHEFSGYRHVSDDATRSLFEAAWDVQLGARAGPAHPEHVRSRARRQFQRALHPGRGHRRSPIRTRSTSPPRCRRWNASSCRTCS